MSLYKKYRPKTLDKVRGNQEVISALKNFISDPEKIPHSILLSGPTGCGKTTIGRILKNELEVTDGDYQEINSSSMRGIDTIRDIIKQTQFKPIESPYRMFLIDECHKLTNDAQNAFLKILEDTPEHVIFILCTTDPQKLIKPIKGRTHTFELHVLTDDEMNKLLRVTCRKEKEKLDDEILEQIIKSSQGHPRNALQILEQVLNVEDDLRLQAAKKAENEEKEAIELCRALIGRKGWKTVSNILANLKGKDEENIRRLVLGYASSVLLKADNETAGLILEEFIEPFYNSGWPGLVFACYGVTKS